MKWIIVTGDTGGLGGAIVNNIMLDSSYGVIGISRTKNEATEMFDDLYKDRYIHINYDLFHFEAIKDLYKNQIKSIGPIYGLVNNSAYAYDDIVTNANVDNLDKVFRINVLSPIMLTKYAIRDMLLNKIEGSIVHITSVCAHTGYRGLSMYASTKGALESFSKTVAREWGGMGIRSNCVAPGFMETGMSETITDEQKNRIYKRNSLKKETELESVAETVFFLISSKSRSITGSVIHVDNGTI